MKPCDFVIFGTLGDLSRRKLLPSLYQLEKAELIAPETTIVGVALGESTDEQYIALACEGRGRGARRASQYPEFLIYRLKSVTTDA